MVTPKSHPNRYVLLEKRIDVRRYYWFFSGVKNCQVAKTAEVE